MVLEMQHRDVTVEHIPVSQNKVAVYLSSLPYTTEKRNYNPLQAINFSNASETNEVTLVNHASSMTGCRLCEMI